MVKFQVYYFIISVVIEKKNQHNILKNNDSIWRYSDNKIVKRENNGKYCTAFNMVI